MDKTSDRECVFTDRQCVFRGTPAVRQKPDAASFCCEFKQVFVPVCLSLCLEFQNLTWKFCIYSLQMSGSLCLFILLVSIFPQTSSLSHADLCFFLFSIRLTVALITDCVIVSATSCKWISLLESIMASEATSYSPGRLSVTQENILITKSSRRRIQKYSFLNDGSLDVE